MLYIEPEQKDYNPEEEKFVTDVLKPRNAPDVTICGKTVDRKKLWKMIWIASAVVLLGVVI